MNMKLDNIKKMQALYETSTTLANLKNQYEFERSKSTCDKHNFEFGGDLRFAVFKCNIFLDCHIRYYGSSSCYTLCTINNETAQRLLNKVLNDQKDEILKLMAQEALIEANGLREKAKEELKILDSIVNEKTKQGE